MVATAGAAKKASKSKPVAQENQAQGLARIAEELGIKSVPRRRNGRPFKASAELVRAIYDDIKAGMQIDRSCILHGVSYAALDQWKRANSDIMRMFEQADAESERDLIKAVRAAIGKDWKAANWLLERRHRWEQVSRTELTGKDGATLTVSQQLFATVAKGGDTNVRPRKLVNVTPPKPSAQGTNNPHAIVDVQSVTVNDTKNDTTKTP